MRPTTSETLISLRRVLAEIVMPVVGDSYARTQINHALLALEDLSRTWADEIPWLIEANDDLEAILRDALDQLQHSVLAHLRPTLEAALARAAKPRPRYPNYEDLVERSNVMRDALSEVIPVLGREGKDFEALRKRIREYLSRNVKRQGGLTEK